MSDTIQINFNAGWTELAQQLHEFNLSKGWWDKWIDDKYRRFPTAYALVMTELAEAIEGDRKSLQDDHLPEFKMFDVEIVDALIRLLDLAGALELGISYEHRRMGSMMSAIRGLTPVEQVGRVMQEISHFAWSNDPHRAITDGIRWCLTIANLHSIDVRYVLERKTLYNMMHADHKKENRDKEGGKKY